jgi:hypothetical protein
MIVRWLVLAAVCAFGGCTLESGKAGATCKRSTQCVAGLACVRGKCSKDLGPIADENTVPDLGGGNEAGVAPAADGGGSGSAAGAAAGGGAGSTAGAAAGNGGSTAGAAG